MRFWDSALSGQQCETTAFESLAQDHINGIIGSSVIDSLTREPFPTKKHQSFSVWVVRLFLPVFANAAPWVGAHLAVADEHQPQL
jgi:hypothetical protein